MTEYATAQVTPGEIEARQLSAAKLRLGLWLAAEPGRTWDRSTLAGSHLVWLWENVRNDPNWQVEHEGEGPTLAAAILSALEAAHA